MVKGAVLEDEQTFSILAIFGNSGICYEFSHMLILGSGCSGLTLCQFLDCIGLSRIWVIGFGAYMFLIC
ncbi:hypothetical protein L1987_18966 [Smallanthus sonchifolius]|uniref:Uncharacterized protein n=1 Tax=Smallanthus sonchifolius TaxID=185202 RepID=A0ACB9J3D7_9ASTR|nr:hypothetical protein L1987_18966 [Smallanthus sonchifolius]